MAFYAEKHQKNLKGHPDGLATGVYPLKNKNMVFVGGYTKSGTTFIGRSLGIFKEVEAYGELDYFRICFSNIQNTAKKFAGNIKTVNEEVYDGNGSIPLVTNDSVRRLHQKTFFHLLLGGKGLNQGCQFVVEKSPRNIFHMKNIQYVFPGSTFVGIYRPADAVFKSLMRHMADHRDNEYANPDFKTRRDMLNGFLERWEKLIEIIETKRSDMQLVSYQSVADDTAGFLDYAKEKIFRADLELGAPIESLSKEAYLKSLPKERREKSLVQVGKSKIQLSEEELSILNENCRAPDVSFDF